MNEYYTKEYMELCKSKKVQNLWLNHYPEHCYWENNHESMESLIWLPDSDDLDEEIFKIFKKWSKDKDIKYSLNIFFSDGKITEYRLTIIDKDWEYTQMGTDLLIVKVRTLIRLLEEQNEHDRKTNL